VDVFGVVNESCSGLVAEKLRELERSLARPLAQPTRRTAVRQRHDPLELRAPVARACAEFSQPSLDSSEALFAAVDEFGLDLGERSLARSSVDDVDGVERHVDTLNTAAPSVSDDGRQLPERLVAQEVAHQGQDDSGTALPVSSTCNSIRPVTRGSFSCQTARRSLRRRSVSPRLSSRRSGVS
jgi:hypothetical protein